MHNSDYTSVHIPYHAQQPYSQTSNHNPNPNPNQNLSEPIYYAPPSYASAPPFSPNPTYNPPPHLSADYSTGSYHPTSSSYTSFPQAPDPLPAAPSYSQPQSTYSFPQFEVHGPYQPPAQIQGQTQLPFYDQPAPDYNSNLNLNPVSPNSYYPSIHPSSQRLQFNAALHETPYDNLEVNLGRSRSDLGAELYGKQTDTGYSGYRSDSLYGKDEGVYAYKGSGDPYRARGTDSKSSTWSGFDDFGRPIGYSSSSGKEQSSNSGLKVVRAVPKADTQQDARSGVQKFRVKLLAESVGQSTMDVLCQIGLDGIRMLDPGTSRILRIYLLDTITRCEAIDSSTFAFWSKSSVDIEPRRIRLQSNSYTTNTILDTVTATIVQYKEMSERSRPSEYAKIAEQPPEKKKGLADFMKVIKPVNEEKDHWVPDEAVAKCTGCGTDFSAFVRKHHCRNCGDIFCDKCTHSRTTLTADENAPVVRVCERCMAEVSHRLSKAKEAASRPTVVQSHEDLAKKLQEEMERSCKVSGSKSDGSGRRMKEVACPTCTVHLQVQVPSSGSETIECGVCQHPFLVTGH
ncbi:Protein free1 [Orobanche gracilis]